MSEFIEVQVEESAGEFIKVLLRVSAVNMVVPDVDEARCLLHVDGFGKPLLAAVSYVDMGAALLPKQEGE